MGFKTARVIYATPTKQSLMQHSDLSYVERQALKVHKMLTDAERQYGDNFGHCNVIDMDGCENTIVVDLATWEKLKKVCVSMMNAKDVTALEDEENYDILTALENL